MIFAKDIFVLFAIKPLLNGLVKGTRGSWAIWLTGEANKNQQGNQLTSILVQ